METQKAPDNILKVQLVESPYPDVPHALPAGPTETNVNHKEQQESDSTADLHLWWREGSQGAYSNTYSHIAVLLIRWCEDLDELHCAGEVEKLEELFRKSFKYETDVVKLHGNTNADLQLCCHIGSFIEKHDGRGSLIIVYYSGHGSLDMESGHLELHPQSGPPRVVRTTQSHHLVRAVWQDAEQHLMRHTNCDVLAILDCCFAGNVHKGGLSDHERTYQLLSAGDKDQITQNPGAQSFTTALIESLSQLLEERKGRPFTTTQLRDRIANQESRNKNPPRLAHRLHTDDRQIFLAPLEEQKRRASQTIAEPSQAFLTLRLALSQGKLDEEQVVTLARNMTQAAKISKVNVQRLDLLNFSVSTRKWNLPKMVRINTLPAVRLMLGFKRSLDTLQEALDSGALSMPATSGAETPVDEPCKPEHLDGIASEGVQESQPKKRKRLPTPESNGRSPGSFKDG